MGAVGVRKQTRENAQERDIAQGAGVAREEEPLMRIALAL